jgi:hypothetical protein
VTDAERIQLMAVYGGLAAAFGVPVLNHWLARRPPPDHAKLTSTTPSTAIEQVSASRSADLHESADDRVASMTRMVEANKAARRRSVWIDRVAFGVNAIVQTLLAARVLSNTVTPYAAIAITLHIVWVVIFYEKAARAANSAEVLDHIDEVRLQIVKLQQQR